MGGDMGRCGDEVSVDGLLARLNGDGPTFETWKPKPGDVLIGQVVDLDEIYGRHGSYPVVVVEQGGQRVAWHAMPTVAKSELSKAAPEVGDRVAIRYDGKAEAGYLRFVVVGEPRRIDWSRYRQAAKS
jgi:hypothetical protein